MFFPGRNKKQKKAAPFNKNEAAFFEKIIIGHKRLIKTEFYISVLPNSSMSAILTDARPSP